MDSTDLPEAVTLAAILVAGFGERGFLEEGDQQYFWGGTQYFLDKREFFGKRETIFLGGEDRKSFGGAPSFLEE